MILLLLLFGVVDAVYQCTIEVDCYYKAFDSTFTITSKYKTYDDVWVDANGNYTWDRNPLLQRYNNEFHSRRVSICPSYGSKKGKFVHMDILSCGPKFIWFDLVWVAWDCIKYGTIFLVIKKIFDYTSSASN